MRAAESIPRDDGRFLPVLLRQEDCNGVAVLTISGRVGESEADGLVTAAERVLRTEPRAVVLDLTGVPLLTDSARCRLAALLDLPSGWPRAPLVLCPPAALPGAPAVMTAVDRAAALAQVEDRVSRPRTRIVVPHDATGPAQARAAVVQSGHLRLAELSDDVALIVSEMVTNAVRHAEPPVAVEVESSDDQVLVAVCDGSSSTPLVRNVDEDEEGGRGMMLVDLLAAEHGVRRQPPGKTVWARIRRPHPA
jgi:anti-sigma regulatory factor (Ser/Thr protein kinase)